MVHIQGALTVSSLGSVTGDIRITGLPFTSHNISSGHAPIDVGYGVGLNITAGYNLSAYIFTNGTNMFLRIWDLAAGQSNLTASEFSATGSIFFAGSYTAA
jgi:hypothetical protein